MVVRVVTLIVCDASLFSPEQSQQRQEVAWEDFWKKVFADYLRRMAVADEKQVFTSATVEEAVQQMEVQAVNSNAHQDYRTS